jgi:hypothetical protein
MKIRITVNGMATTATLADNATARDFASMLPLTLTFEDYASTEKIGYLPRKLTEEGGEPFQDPAIGDINYYAPWGNLAIFYRDYRYSNGLIRLGRLDGSVDAVMGPGRPRMWRPVCAAE